MRKAEIYKISEPRIRLKISQRSIGIIAISLAAGLLNGLVGAGGGIALSLGFSALIGDTVSEKKEIYFNSQAAMIPVCAVSYFLYLASGEMPSVPPESLLLPAAAGGIIGGLLSSRIESKYIRLIFAAIVLFSGIRMLLSVL